MEADWNVLMDCHTEQIVKAVSHARPDSEAEVPYGDGRAAEQIVKLVAGVLSKDYHRL